MGSANALSGPRGLAAQCFRLTARGRACVELVRTGRQTVGSLSLYLHDVLMMCGTGGAWFQQLQQFMPPRSLEESLQALMSLGLIECVDQRELPFEAPPAADRSMLGYAARA